jgi:flagellin-like protein
MKSKAISPLISTILLVVVAVVLVTIVLTWGQNFANDSLSETTAITDNSCLDTVGSLYVSKCSVLSDGNITFQLKNNNNNYEFPPSDVFTIEIFDDVGNSENYTMAGAEVLSPATWEGLHSGETKVIKIKPGSIETNNSFEITVKSSVCPANAISKTTCQ